MRLAVVLALLAFLPVRAAAQAEDVLVVLKNGESLWGSQLSLVKREVSILTDNGTPRTFAIDALTRVDTFVPYTVETTSGEKIHSQLSLRKKRGDVLVYVDIWKPREIPLSMIVSISAVAVSDPKNDSAGSTNGDKTSDHDKTEPSAASATDATAKIPTKLGKPPEDEDLHKLFLRRMSVLLQMGQLEVETAFSYIYSRSFDPTQNELSYSRYAQLSMAWSLGLFSFMQASVSVPLVFHDEYNYWYADGREQRSRQLQPGNLATALNAQIVRESGPWPAVMVVGVLSLPLVSDSTNTADPSGKVQPGLWSTTAGISFVETADPITVVGGVSYTHSFESTISGKRTQEGDFWGYMLGIGFAVSGKVSLNANFHGGWQGRTVQDGRGIVDTEAEPMGLGMGFVYVASRSWFASPTLIFPLNVDGGSVILSLPLGHRF